jgi:short-subunit dehydrogenase
MAFALITGSSKGIGKAIAQQLAQKGKPVLLIARNEGELKQAASAIAHQFKVEVQWLVADLSDTNAPKKIFDWCQSSGYDVDVLVNNAGYGLSGPFEKFPLDAQLSMMRVNMEAVVSLTALFLPVLRKHSKSYILNIASSAGYQATPYLGLYAATKSFVRLFSRALHHELKASNVSVTCVNPGATDTSFNDRAQVGQKARDLAKKVNMTADDVAAIAVAAMYSGKTEVITGFINKMGAFLVWLLPKKLIEGSAAKIYQ